MAFEPDLENYAKAIKNIKLNSFQNIDLMNIGLGDKKEKLKLADVNINNPGMKRISKSETGSFKWVDIEKLDDLIHEKENLLDRFCKNRC